MLCIIGDTHGHLQLALCMAARWQRELDVEFEAVLLCGDVATFTVEAQLDNATRRHARSNPCELEFLHQWSVDPQPPWLAPIFAASGAGGLGLQCPVVMVHGNHEGFAHLARLAPRDAPDDPVQMAALPAVDTAGHIRYLPSGWRCRTHSRLVVGGVGGIEPGQREADYHPLAYIDEEAVLRLLAAPPVDVLLTHQGPSALQTDEGSESLQLLLDEGRGRFWFHGHSMTARAIRQAGPASATTVVPLGAIAFSGKGPKGDDPGADGWAVLTWEGGGTVRRERPPFWREYRQRRWTVADGGVLIAPDLARWV